MNTSASAPHTHRLYAVDHHHNRIDGALFASHQEALDAWEIHDRARLAGRRPHVKFYEVRDECGALREALKRRCDVMFCDSLTPRGRLHVEDAARDALRVRAPFTPSGETNGAGGWFYLGGRVLCQGLRGPNGLGQQMLRRGLVAQDAHGRWHGAALMGSVEARTRILLTLAAAGPLTPSALTERVIPNARAMGSLQTDGLVALGPGKRGMEFTLTRVGVSHAQHLAGALR